MGLSTQRANRNCHGCPGAPAGAAGVGGHAGGAVPPGRRWPFCAFQRHSYSCGVRASGPGPATQQAVQRAPGTQGPAEAACGVTGQHGAPRWVSDGRGSAVDRARPGCPAGPVRPGGRRFGQRGPASLVSPPGAFARGAMSPMTPTGPQMEVGTGGRAVRGAWQPALSRPTVSLGERSGHRLHGPLEPQRSPRPPQSLGPGPHVTDADGH